MPYPEGTESGTPVQNKGNFLRRFFRMGQKATETTAHETISANPPIAILKQTEPDTSAESTPTRIPQSEVTENKSVPEPTSVPKDLFSTVLSIVNTRLNTRKQTFDFADLASCGQEEIEEVRSKMEMSSSNQEKERLAKLVQLVEAVYSYFEVVGKNSTAIEKYTDQERESLISLLAVTPEDVDAVDLTPIPEPVSITAPTWQNEATPIVGIQKGSFIGHGGMVDVYHGTITIATDHEPTDVALKFKRPDCPRGEDPVQFENDILEKLRQRYEEESPDKEGAPFPFARRVNYENQDTLIMELLPPNIYKLYKLEDSRPLDVLATGIEQYMKAYHILHSLGYSGADRKASDLRYDPRKRRLIISDWNVNRKLPDNPVPTLTFIQADIINGIKMFLEDYTRKHFSAIDKYSLPAQLQKLLILSERLKNLRDGSSDLLALYLCQKIRILPERFFSVPVVTETSDHRFKKYLAKLEEDMWKEKVGDNELVQELEDIWVAKGKPPSYYHKQPFQKLAGRLGYDPKYEVYFDLLAFIAKFLDFAEHSKPTELSKLCRWEEEFARSVITVATGLDKTGGQKENIRDLIGKLKKDCGYEESIPQSILALA